MSWTLLIHSLGVGTGATVLALVVGFAIAMAAAASARWRGTILACAAASLAMNGPSGSGGATRRRTTRRAWQLLGVSPRRGRRDLALSLTPQVRGSLG